MVSKEETQVEEWLQRWTYSGAWLGRTANGWTVQSEVHMVSNVKKLAWPSVPN